MPDTDGQQQRQQAVAFEEGMLCDSAFRAMDMSGVTTVDCDTEGMTIDGVLVSGMLRLWKSRTPRRATLRRLDPACRGTLRRRPAFAPAAAVGRTRRATGARAAGSIATPLHKGVHA